MSKILETKNVRPVVCWSRVLEIIIRTNKKKPICINYFIHATAFIVKKNIPKRIILYCVK